MAEQNPAVFLQAGSHPAEDLRRFVSSVMGDRPGIVGAGDLAVTQTGTPSMAVSVAAGRAFIKGTENAYQGLYFVEERGAKTLSIAPADSTNTRYDLVVARVKDASYSGTVSAWSLEVVTGTASATPAEPTVPPNSLVLARVTVAKSVTSITNANIQERRLTTTGQGFASALRADLLVTATTLPASGDFDGQAAYETDTDRMRRWDGTRWRYEADRVVVADVAARDALSAYDSLQAYVISTGLTYERVSGAWAVRRPLAGVTHVRQATVQQGDTAPAPKLWAAVLDAPFSGVSYSIVNVTFTGAGFADAPAVTITPGGGNSYGLYAGVDSVTATGCTVTLRSGVNVPGTLPLHVIAVGR